MSGPNGCTIPAIFGVLALLLAPLIGVVLNESDLSLPDLTSSDPCTIQAERANVAVRVGPGPNRAIRIYLPANQAFPVVGKATAGDGSLWWRVEIAGVEQAWVAQDEVAASGGCALVADVDAPPIVLAPPTVTPGSIDMSADIGETPLLSDNPSDSDAGDICVPATVGGSIIVTCDTQVQLPDVQCPGGEWTSGGIVFSDCHDSCGNPMPAPPPAPGGSCPEG